MGTGLYVPVAESKVAGKAILRPLPTYLPPPIQDESSEYGADS